LDDNDTRATRTRESTYCDVGYVTLTAHSTATATGAVDCAQRLGRVCSTTRGAAANTSSCSSAVSGSVFSVTTATATV
jgi:hypothetical protein